MSTQASQTGVNTSLNHLQVIPKKIAQNLNKEQFQKLVEILKESKYTPQEFNELQVKLYTLAKVVTSGATFVKVMMLLKKPNQSIAAMIGGLLGGVALGLYLGRVGTKIVEECGPTPFELTEAQHKKILQVLAVTATFRGIEKNSKTELAATFSAIQATVLSNKYNRSSTSKILSLGGGLVGGYFGAKAFQSIVK